VEVIKMTRFWQRLRCCVAKTPDWEVVKLSLITRFVREREFDDIKSEVIEGIAGEFGDLVERLGVPKSMPINHALDLLNRLEATGDM